MQYRVPAIASSVHVQAMYIRISTYRARDRVPEAEGGVRTRVRERIARRSVRVCGARGRCARAACACMCAMEDHRRSIRISRRYQQNNRRSVGDMYINNYYVHTYVQCHAHMHVDLRSYMHGRSTARRGLHHAHALYCIRVWALT